MCLFVCTMAEIVFKSPYRLTIITTISITVQAYCKDFMYRCRLTAWAPCAAGCSRST